MNKRPLIMLAAAAIASALAAPSFAQNIYKSVQRDGSVLYSDKPMPGAPRVTRIDPAQGTLSIIPDPLAQQVRRERAAAEQRIVERQIALDRADAEVKAATLAVESAQARLEASQEPLPGERTANAGGGTRLNDVYLGRMAALQQQLETAQQRLDAAYAARNSVRD